jgi:hypothetical protein
MSPRPLTEIDRMLAFGDALDAAGGETPKARRRTHRRFGHLDVIVIEVTGEATKVYLSNTEDGSAIVEATALELAQTAAAVAELLANPPPTKKKSR